MTHAEIWDDSTLVDSWNEALEEYKLYHSIHARGEKVEDILRAHDDQNNSPEIVNERPEGQSSSNGEKELTNVDDNDGSEVVDCNVQPEIQPHEKLPSQSQASTMVREKATVQGSDEPPPLPEHLVGSVHNEDLKKLLMSWYYAGYYTGFYEGQQQPKHVDA